MRACVHAARPVCLSVCLRALACPPPRKRVHPAVCIAYIYIRRACHTRARRTASTDDFSTGGTRPRPICRLPIDSSTVSIAFKLSPAILFSKNTKILFFETFTMNLTLKDWSHSFSRSIQSSLFSARFHFIKFRD